MKTDRMRSFEENLLGKSEDGASKNVETDDDEYQKLQHIRAYGMIILHYLNKLNQIKNKGY